MIKKKLGPFIRRCDSIIIAIFNIKFCGFTLQRVLFDINLHAYWLHICANKTAKCSWNFIKIISYIIYNFNKIYTGVDIDPCVEIGENPIWPHANVLLLAIQHVSVIM